MSIFKELEQVVKINSFTKNKSGVDEVGFVFKSWFEAIGFETQIYQRELIGNHLLFKSKRVDGERILLLGHIDTVFPKGDFEGFREDDEWVYGAGVCDMKGGIIVILEALRSIAKDGEIKNIDILLVSDEESGSDDSKFITEELSQDYKYCFVFEAAGESGEVVVARKGIGTFNIYITGKASHAGNHYLAGIDANLEASYKLQELVNLTDIPNDTTVNVGKIEGGIGANTISPKSHLLFEIRYTNMAEKERVLSKINEIVATEYVKGSKAVLDGLIQRDVMEFTDIKKTLIERLEQISNCEILVEKRGGGSDANIASKYSLTLDGFGPFGDGDHTVNERALKKSFFERVDLVTKILKYHQQYLKLI